MNGKANKIIENIRNHFFSLILNLPIDSSPQFSRKNNEFHKKFFSNIVIGDDINPTMTIGIYYELFHVLQTKFHSKEVNIMLENEFPFEIQCNLSSVHKILVLNFNLQVDSLLIHLSHELHDVTESLSNSKL